MPPRRDNFWNDDRVRGKETEIWVAVPGGAFLAAVALGLGLGLRPAFAVLLAIAAASTAVVVLLISWTRRNEGSSFGLGVPIAAPELPSAPLNQHLRGIVRSFPEYSVGLHCVALVLHDGRIIEDVYVANAADVVAIGRSKGCAVDLAMVTDVLDRCT